MNNIKKIIILILTLSAILFAILFYFRNIAIIPDGISKIKIPSEVDLIKAKNIKIMEIKIPDDIPKSDYDYIYNYLSSLYKSSFNIIDEDKKVLTFAISETLSEDKEKELKDKIKEILNTKKYKEKDALYVVTYPAELFKYILDTDFNYEYKDMFDGKHEVFRITEPGNTKDIQERDLKKFFNDDTIKKGFEVGKTYFQEKSRPYAYKGLAGTLIPKKSNSYYEFLEKKFKQGYDITEKSVPIIVLFKYKKQGSGILVQEYNKIKYREISKAYNNFEEFIKQPEKLISLTDDKGFSQQYNNIYNFTEFDPEKYYKLFFKGKGYKIVKQDKNKLLLKGDGAYIALYFDYDKQYKYDKSKFPPTGNTYIFKILKTVSSEPILNKSIYDGLNIELEKKGFNKLEGKSYKKIGNSLIIN